MNNSSNEDRYGDVARNGPTGSSFRGEGSVTFKASNQRQVIHANLHELVASDPFRDETEKDYIILCPYCREVRGKERRKLYIAKNYMYGHCWTCDNIFRPTRSSFTKPSFLYEKASQNHDFIGIEPINLDLIDEAMEESEEGIEYLGMRPDPLVSSDYQDFGIKFVKNGILLPIKSFGSDDPVYYQIRYIKPFNPDMKYFMPTISEKPIAVVHEGVSETAWCVEGIFGAIALSRLYPEDTILAFLGKKLTQFHAWQLSSQRYTTFKVFLDDTDLSIKFGKQLLSCGIFSPKVYYVESDGRDPDETIRDYKRIDEKPLNLRKETWKKTNW